MEPFLHWIIPTVILLAFFPQLNRKWILFLSPLTFIADFDKFLPGMHRVLLYNIFFMAVVIAALFLAFRKQKAYFWAGTYLFLSHYLLDSSFPGGALLWPLVQRMYFMDFNLTYDHAWIFDFKAGSIPIGGGISEPSYWMYTQGFLIIILMAATFAIWYSIRKRQHETKSPLNQ